MTIDLHVHTAERSSCGNSTEEEQIQAAINAGLDAIVFSDHDRLVPRKHLQELNDRYAPFRIFGGIEVGVWDWTLCTSEHFLVLGIHDPLLESSSWTYPALYQFVREQNGFIAVAHLYRFRPISNLNLKRFPPDALEIDSNNISPKLSQRLLALAEKLHLPGLSNSDAHHADLIGNHYNILDTPPLHEQELIQLLKAGQFQSMSPR
jgi:predicted metal-dependent phosphoesterase TrpH